MITNLYITSASWNPSWKAILSFWDWDSLLSLRCIIYQLFQEVCTSDTHGMLQPPTSSSVSDTNFHTNLFGKCVHLMPSPVTVRKRNRMWNEATSVRTRWGFQKHLSKKVASWSGWMSPNGQPRRMILLEEIILQILFHTFSHSLAIQTLQDSLISFCHGIWICFSFWNPA